MTRASAITRIVPGARTTTAGRGAGPLRASQRRAGILFSLPVIVLTGALLFLPIIQTFYYSLTTWDGIHSTWIGLDNYQRLVSDSVFWRVLLNNMFLLASIPFALLIPLVVAFLLHQHVVGWRFFRSV